MLIYKSRIRYLLESKSTYSFFSTYWICCVIFWLSCWNEIIEACDSCIVRFPCHTMLSCYQNAASSILSLISPFSSREEMKRVTLALWGYNITSNWIMISSCPVSNQECYIRLVMVIKETPITGLQQLIFMLYERFCSWRCVMRTPSPFCWGQVEPPTKSKKKVGAWQDLNF